MWSTATTSTFVGSEVPSRRAGSAVSSQKEGEPAAGFASLLSVALSPHRSATLATQSAGPRRIGARGSSIIGTGRCFSDHLVDGSPEWFTRSRLGTGRVAADHVLREGWGAAALPLMKSRQDREPQPRPSALFLVRERRDRTRCRASPTPRGVVRGEAPGSLSRDHPHPRQRLVAVATGGPVTVRRYSLASKRSTTETARFGRGRWAKG
jgi:hypothetical protein